MEASGRKISLEIFRKHWKLSNTTEMKNAVYSQKNQESLCEKNQMVQKLPIRHFRKLSRARKRVNFVTQNLKADVLIKMCFLIQRTSSHAFPIVFGPKVVSILRLVLDIIAKFSKCYLSFSL